MVSHHAKRSLHVKFRADHTIRIERIVEEEDIGCCDSIGAYMLLNIVGCVLSVMVLQHAKRSLPVKLRADHAQRIDRIVEGEYIGRCASIGTYMLFKHPR